MAGHGKRVLLDTTALIDLLHRRPAIQTTLKSLLQRGFEPTTSAVNVAEIYAGVRHGEQGITDALVDSLSCFDVTRELARRAGQLVAARRRAGRTHALDDMIIAATAIENDCQLLTGNRKDFEVPGVRFYSQPTV